MRQRLQINMKGEDLKRRIGEAIATCESKLTALEDRIKARDGDQPYDVRVEDGFASLQELETERTQVRDRITQLALLRDSVVSSDEYALSKSDLRAAGIISQKSPDEPGCMEGDWVDCSDGVTIDGLKLKFSGEELRTRLDARRRDHEERAARWRHELTRGPQDQTEDEPLLPDHICENEAERHDWHAEVSAFIRDHIDAEEVYQLGQADLEFGELLPEKPGWMKQDEHEERRRVGFSLERIAKKI